MARLVLVLLIAAEILMLQAVANESKVNPVGVKSELSEDEPTGVVSGIADQPVSSHSDSSDNDDAAAAPGPPEIRRLGKHYQHHSDKSEAGGGVIIGGLITAIFAAVFSYIRVTRKRNNTEHS